MNSNSGSTNTTLITFVVVVFVVVRFLYSELKARVVQKKWLWVRPAFLAVISALLIAMALTIPGAQPALVVLMAVIGAVLGWFTGTLVLRFTTFSPADIPGAVRAIGSTKSVIVWIVAIGVRFVARFLFAGGGDGLQLALNVFTVVLVTVAFVVVSIGFQRAIDANPASTTPVSG